MHSEGELLEIVCPWAWRGRGVIMLPCADAEATRVAETRSVFSGAWHEVMVCWHEVMVCPCVR